MLLRRGQATEVCALQSRLQCAFRSRVLLTFAMLPLFRRPPTRKCSRLNHDTTSPCCCIKSQASSVLFPAMKILPFEWPAGSSPEIDRAEKQSPAYGSHLPHG